MKSTLTFPKFRLALCTPLLWYLAGQGWGGFVLGWIALAPLFVALHDLPLRSRLKLGWGIGWLSYFAINWWIIPTITKGSPVLGFPYAGGAALATFAVALIAVIHGFHVALVAMLWDSQHRFFRRAPWVLPIVVALAWGVLDWTRSITPLAHMWGALAYSQWRDLPLLQSAGWIGQHGLSALCIWFAASFALWFAQPGGVVHPVMWRAPAVVFVALHVWGWWVLNAPEPATRTLRVLLVQTNISALRKAQGRGETPLQEAARLTREYFEAPTAEPVDLVVWPESVLNFRRWGKARTPSGLEWSEFSELSREFKTPILAGGLSRSAGESGEELRNEATLALPDGTSQNSGKVRLVPFGERAVGGEIWPFLKRFAPDPPLVYSQSELLKLPLQGNSAGGSTLPLGTLICFESCFPTPATYLKNDGARVLFILTNDEWFSGTEAPWQHAAMAAMRAAENRVPVAQTSNGGYAVAVDAKGRFTAISEYNRAQTVRVDLQVK